MGYSVQEDLLERYYGIKGCISELPGDVDRNYKVKTEEGKRYILKMSRAGASLENWEIQAEIFRHLELLDTNISLPRLIKSVEGDEIIKYKDGHLVRLLTWVPGRVIADISPRSDDLFRSWGKTIAQLTKGLQGFDHKGLHAPFMWDPSQTLDSRPRLQYFRTQEQKDLATYYWDYFESEILGKLTSLRKSVIYGDGHEHNLMSAMKASDNFVPATITGVIDFGDATYTYTICDLAIALAYACMGRKEPLQAARKVIEGYNEVFPWRKMNCRFYSH